MATPTPEGWQTGSDEEYDPERIYTRAEDARGHSDRISVTLPTYVIRALAALRESDAYSEYRSIADVIRDSVYHNIHRREQQLAEGRIPELSAARARQEIEARLTMLKENDASVDDLKVLESSAMSRNHFETLDFLETEALELADRLGLPWSEECKRVAERVHSYLHTHRARLRQV